MKNSLGIPRAFCVLAAALFGFTGITVHATSVTYTMSTTNVSATTTLDQNNNSPGKGFFNSGTFNGLGLFAHDGGGGIVRATAYEKFTINGNGASGTARSLQAGDQFTITLHDQTVAFSSNPGIYFNDSTNFAEGQFANTNRLSLTLHTDGKWYLNQNGVDTYVNVPVGTDPTLLLTVTSSNTFNVSVKTGATTVFTSSDLLMSNNPGVNSLIQSFAMVQQNDKNNGGNTDLVLYGASLSDTGAVNLGASNNTTTISGSIKDGLAANSTSSVTSNSVTKSGTGTITLSGTNSYTGTTTVSNGVLEATATTALPGYNTAGKVIVSSGATIAAAVGGAGQWSSADLDALRTNATFNGASFFGIDTAGGNFTYGSTISQAFGLSKLGANTLTLTGPNSYSGVTNINAGSINVQSNTALGSTAAGTVVASGAALELQSNVSVGAEALTLNGDGLSANGALRSVTGSNSYAGAITLGSDARIHSSAGSSLTLTGGITNAGFRTTFSGSGDITLGAGAITGTGDLLKQGSGTLNFNASNAGWAPTTNSNTSLFVDSGIISVGSGGNIGNTNGTTTGRIAFGSSNAGTAGDLSLLITTGGTTLANPIDVRFFSGVTSGKLIGGTNTSGVAEYSGAITLHDSVTLSASGAGGLGITRFSGVIATGANDTPYTGEIANTAVILFNAGPGVFIAGPGTVEFTGVNTYTGETYIKSGTLQFKSGGNITGGGSIRLGDDVASSTAAVNIADASTVSTTVNTRAGAGGTKTISGTNATGTTATYSGHIALDSDATVTSTTAGATLAFTQALATPSPAPPPTGFDIKNHVLTVTGSGNVSVGTTTTTNGTIYNSTAGGSLIKSGSGTLTFNDQSTYTGGTTVNGGKLLANNTSGSATGTGAVSVNNSGTTLGGSGFITGSVTVGNGANLSPGNSPGILHVGALTLSSGSNLLIELAGSAPGTGYDQVISPGAISVAGANLILTTSALLAVNQKFFIVEDSSNTANPYGSFSNGSTATDNLGDTFLINYADNGDGGLTANDISLTVLTVVPEPGTWATGALALAGLLGTQRRRLRRLLKRA